MESKPRLTIASMWAFEEIGLQELQHKFREIDPGNDCLFEYSKSDDLLSIKGNTDATESKLVALISEFIEEQKNKDLLDVPRVRQLDVPSVFDDGINSIMESPGEAHHDVLLTLDGDPDEELVSNVINGTTKSWLSPKGGLGCFVLGFQDILTEVEGLTGTRISIVDDRKGMQITGKSAGDVDDAMGKLTRIEKPLSLLGKPRFMNLLVDQGEDACFRIKNYTSLNNVALRRILTDSNESTNAGLYQAFVTLLYRFDSESQMFNVPESILNPPHATSEPGPSRIWIDFNFQELGKGDGFLDLQSIIDEETASPQTMETGIMPPHPYLTAEKANQVNRWRTDMGATGPDPEPSDNLQSVLSGESAMAPPPVKKVPGIKTRRPVPQGQIVQQQPKLDTTITSVEANATVPEETEVAVSNDTEKEDLVPPRRKWKMTYHSSSNRHRSSSEKNVERPVAAKVPENRSRIPANFDASKYGLSQNLMDPPEILGSGTLTQKVNSPPKITRNKGPGERDLLIDLTPATDTQTNSHPLISFDQPALVPQNLLATSNLVDVEEPFRQQSSGVITDKIPSNLVDYDDAAEDGSAYMGPSSNSTTVATPATRENNSNSNERRLLLLKRLSQETHRTTRIEDASMSRPGHTPYTNSDFLKERTAELVRGRKIEEKQDMDEVFSREFHRTMLHKAAESEKAKSKKVKRQATLEDVWGIPQRPKEATDVKKEPSEESESETKLMESNQQRLQLLQAETAMNEQVTRLFEALQPTLNAAEYFPGTLTLESHIGLILIPLLPKTYSEGRLISVNEWNKIFQPRNGLPSPTTKFISRLTTSGADVDYIVDLKRSKDEGRDRLFEQEYTDYRVFYEYHCRTDTDQAFFITIDENGKLNLKKPTRTLGAVNLHFPGQTWDASMVVNGNNDYSVNSDKEVEEAVHYLMDNFWVRPERSLVRIFTRLPKGNKLVIEKAFMKRWTRHRYIPSTNAATEDISTTESSSGAGSGAAASMAENGETNSLGDQDSVITDSENENQDLFVQVTEVQDLFLGISPSDSQAVRASCAPLPEMIKKGRLWHEVSVVSPAIEAILKTNSNLEVGERTDDWRSTDLLGKDAFLVRSGSNASTASNNTVEPSSPTAPAPTSASASITQPPLHRVESALGPAGLGGMLRLTKTIVEKIDGVGYFNVGPGVEAARLAAASGTILGGQTAPPTAIDTLIRLEQKSVDSDNMESDMDLGTASQVVPVDSSLAAMEQAQLEYW